MDVYNPPTRKPSPPRPRRRVIMTATFSLAAALSLGAPPATADVLTVHPTGDCLLDAVLIQDAIDVAHPGDTVELAAGTFCLGGTTTRDVFVQTASGGFHLTQDLRADPTWNAGLWERGLEYDASGDLIAWDPSIDIWKPLTLRGAGELQTILSVPDGLEWRWTDAPGDSTVFGFTGSVIVNAPDVTIENLVFDSLLEPLWAFSPGFNIQNNLFQNTGYGLFLAPDGDLTYPNYPSLDEAVASSFRDNTCQDCYFGPGIVGSAIVIADNALEVTGTSGIALRTWHTPALDIGLPINWDHSDNNSVVNNYVDMLGHGSGIQITNEYGITASSNHIQSNVVRNASGDGIWISGWDSANPGSEAVASSNNVVFGNRIERTLWPLGVTGPTARNNVLAKNSIVDSVNPDIYGSVAPGLLVSASNNMFRGNDFHLSGYPGAASPYGLQGVSVLMSSDSLDNLVVANKVTDPCDQVVDLGENSVAGIQRCTRWVVPNIGDSLAAARIGGKLESEQGAPFPRM